MSNVKQAVKAYNRLYHAQQEAAAFAYEMDCGFDAGEFCGKMHDIANRKGEKAIAYLVAYRFKLTLLELENAVYRYWQDQESKFFASLETL